MTALDSQQKETLMSSALRVVTINGSPHQPSRTSVILQALVERLTEHAEVSLHRVEIADLIGEPLAATPETASERLRADLHAVETADLILAGSPVYKSSYTGLFKYFLDLVDQYALVDVPVVLVATGGSERHNLVVEHQLRPLFAFFQTATSPLGIYAHTSDFEGYQIASAALRARVNRAADRAYVAVTTGASLRELNPASL